MTVKLSKKEVGGRQMYKEIEHCTHKVSVFIRPPEVMHGVTNSIICPELLPEDSKLTFGATYEAGTKVWPCSTMDSSKNPVGALLPSWVLEAEQKGDLTVRDYLLPCGVRMTLSQHADVAEARVGERIFRQFSEVR